MKYDLHVHTHLSSCAARDAFIKDYVAEAKRIGLGLIGFSDHAWDAGVPGCSEWYRPQGYERLEARRAEAEGLDTGGLEVRFGAEGEFARLVLGITDEAKRFVDYIIVPNSHTHMHGFVISARDAADPKKHADYLCESFIALCRHERRDLFCGIAHPMFPVASSEELREAVYANITDRQLEDCAKAAKKAGLFLEVNYSSFASIPPEKHGADCYFRFFRACVEQGCDFFTGSDTHSVPRLAERTETREKLLADLCINEKMLEKAREYILNL